MQNVSEGISDNLQSAKGKKNRGICTACFRWLFIILFAVILVGGLYFKAPWKVLALDAILLALLTVIPKSLRKYGWLTLAVAVLAVTVWIFIPEKDAGNWKPYTFDEELAVLEAKRFVPAEDNAAPLYEALFGRWQQIEETDPFPENADECGQTIDRPWTADEFPEVAAWLDRHKDFFQDVMTATQKSGCYFPVTATPFDLSDPMERLSPPKQFAQHLIRASQLDIGEHKSGAWQKQVAVLNLGKHMNQQPMLLDVLVGMAIESLTHDVMLNTLVDTNELSKLTDNEYSAAIEPLRTSHFDHKEKWKQSLAYEKLLFKNNFCGLIYEVNPEGRIRYSRLKTLINAVNGTYPNEQIDQSEVPYWAKVGWKFSKVIFWLSGLPKNFTVISEWVNDEYTALEQAFETKQDEFFKNVTRSILPFELNCKYAIHQMSQISLPAYNKIQELFTDIQTKKKGVELVCDLVNYKRQHSRYPDTLEQIEPLKQDKHVSAESYKGFVYQKTENSFMLYNIGPNGLDEKGIYRMSKYDPNDGMIESLMNMKLEADDILIWPKELEESTGSQ